MEVCTYFKIIDKYESPSNLLLVEEGKIPHFQNKIGIDCYLAVRVSNIEDLI